MKQNKGQNGGKVGKEERRIRENTKRYEGKKEKVRARERRNKT